MRNVTVSAFLALSLLGCGGSAAPHTVPGPAPADLDRAYQLVWEGVYSMTVATRPAITWWAPCGPPTGGDDPPCADEYSTPGVVNLVWYDSAISDTHFSVMLEGEREWIVYPSGTLAPESEVDRLTAAAQAALRSAGE